MLEFPLLTAIVVIALLFDLTNGIHDSANAIATVVSTKVLSPMVAVIMAAALNFSGAFIGTQVAHTIGSGIVDPNLVAQTQALVLAALVGAIFWNLLTWYLGMPSSSSHALIGGLIGAAIQSHGWHAVSWNSVTHKVLIPLVVSPVSGFIGGYLLMILIAWCFSWIKPQKGNTLFRRLQILSSAFLATSHGMNDAQKTMGVITLALFTFHKIPTIEVPTWVKLASATAMFIGTATGGWRIIKTMGHGIFRMEPVHGCASETAAAIVITTASGLGAPISTTHTISSALMGVGASKRVSAVRWRVVGNMLTTWVFTIPCAAVISAGIFYLIAMI
jgi:inorganic phosphate transporter, PiT family